jgi:hypothetical protein
MRVADRGAQRRLGRERIGEDESHVLELVRPQRIANRGPAFHRLWPDSFGTVTMTVDLSAWRKVVEEVVGAIADENLQRRAWFGIGPEETSPEEHICQFFGDAAIEDFLVRDDTGLSEQQLEAGRYLLHLMEELSSQTSVHIDPSDLIDDSRWKEIRRAATRFHQLLRTQN